MSWRTVVISKRAKLDMKTGYLVVRSEEETHRINLDEISVLIIENTAVSITGCLISALTDKKIKVIFCDEKRDPTCELVALYGSHDTSAKLRKQIKWDDDVKAYIWSEIIAEKIRKQTEFLEELGKSEEAFMLKSISKSLNLEMLLTAKVMLRRYISTLYLARNLLVVRNVLQTQPLTMVTALSSLILTER